MRLRFLGEADKAFDLIADHPELFAPIQRDIRRAVLNKFPFGVFYVHRSNLISVIAVMHVVWHPGSWQRRV